RRSGDFSIAPSAVIAPAPQLALDAQQSLAARFPSLKAAGGEPSKIIAPPPSLAGIQASHSGGVTALSLHPAVGVPPAPPAGNRRGTFAATPEGHPGATGSAGTHAGETSHANAGTGSGKAGGAGSSGRADSNLPSGLYVGKASSAAPVAGNSPARSSNADWVNPRLIAGSRPRLPVRALQPESKSVLSEEERAVFGNRKFYSLTLNMPNLNSAGGSWVIRFAALKPESGSGSPSSADASAGDPATAPDLSAPTATRKVDPAYPLELMRQNVGGVVMLYAIIHADGTVGDVRVLRSDDERLDQFARNALGKWQFSPAARNGTAVDVEAIFRVPFRPGR
ncbi:MAG TPA: energy transducer TonB, partial [Candidatus Binatia bacterium]|nr:energy transducer TonB [Candidatus Binatia bacterium]